MMPAVEVGKRVVVPFGRKKFYSGVIFSIHANTPVHYEAKEVVAVLDSHPIVNQKQFKFWTWMADYYQCTPGDVYKAALPSGLKLESESHVFYNSDHQAEVMLNEKETLVVDFVSEKKSCTINEIQNHTGINTLLPILNRLIDEGIVSVSEQMREAYKPKTINIMALAPAFQDNDKLKAAFDDLGRAPKQVELLMLFIQMVGFNDAINGKSVQRTALLEKSGDQASALSGLIKRGILVQEQMTVGRLDYSSREVIVTNPLSESQQIAIDAIRNLHAQKETVLLHGVTSSGKTEIYIHLIEEQINKGKQVLYLLPEIALTAQITSRLKKHFGNHLGIYHSKYSDAERVEVWNDLLEQSHYKVILGVRSSIFLPFDNLGLIIIDEEHETSYKQFDPAPRYHARDSALVLAHYHGAKVLLGTATPSIETYFNVQSGKYGLVELMVRHKGIQMPEIITVDVREARRKKQMRSHFTPLLIEQIGKALANKEQVILFQNRRGFSPYVECSECASIPKCKHCDVSMTYHKHINHLTCHYCGYSYVLPASCPACGSPSLETRGFGTEKIEEEIKIFFPDARVSRMDLDTTRTKKAHENIIAEFETGDVDILIGTQMISKGLDFERVSIVGILDADSMLNYPDFRAHERAFQLMAQVSGRAGRKNRQGKVILQTTDPSHLVIRQVINNDFKGLYDTQLAERQMFKYPPFYRIVNLTVKHSDMNKVTRAASNLANGLRHVFGERVLGPHAPVIGRIQNLHIRQIVMKIEKTASISKSKEMIQATIHQLLAQPEYRGVIVQIDVDPQ
jgi:primosomal protein N' (replication factor Y)